MRQGTDPGGGHWPRWWGVAASLTALVAGTGLCAGVAGAAPVTPTAGPSAAATVHDTQVCPPPAPGYDACLAIVQTDAASGADVRSLVPFGYSPGQLRSAYGLTGASTGHPLVAVVDAFGDSHVVADLAAYRSQFHLPAMAQCTSALSAQTCFDRVTQTGATTGFPRNDNPWDTEQSLDVDMVSAACPRCSILLVQSTTASYANLAAAEKEAVSLGAVVLSNSYSGSLHAADAADYTFPGVAVVASTGDNGYLAAASAPAGYPGVVAAGGTTLTSITPRVESAWSGAGSYCATAFTQPPWQVGVVSGCTGRAAADLSVDADPATGVAVYDQGWIVEGGTSVSSPFISGSIAAVGNWAAFGVDGASYLYGHRSDFAAITSGSNGACGTALCTAHGGWDGPAGLGTPTGPAAL